MAFDQPTRNRLARFVGDARALLSAEFTRQLQLEYGLDPETGAVAALETLTHLDDSRRETARILRNTLAHYLAGQAAPKGKAPTDAARREVLARSVREQAYTVLNRLCALRMAEARGLLVESIARGYQSKGFQLYARLAGTALGETGDAYRSYLFSLFDEFAVDLAVLFDRFSPQGRLFPREAALLQLLDALNHPDIAPLWAEDETLGWIYQYFNSDEERRQMRAESQAPRNSRELAVRNQFFTPRYVVEFLTDNTLGRLWYEMTQGETALKEHCRYLVRRPNEIFLAEGDVRSEPEAVSSEQTAEALSQEELLQQPVYIPYRARKDPREIKMLDPACGSMHFGLYAFDLFERIYEEAWDLETGERAAGCPHQPGPLDRRLPTTDYHPLTADYPDKAAFLRDVPRLIIEHNIHGIDIDPRAAQIAGLSLWLRAQRSWQAQGLKPQERPQIQRSNVVCAEPMPGDKTLLAEFTATLPYKVLGQLVELIFDKMTLAGEAGSLLKIEEELTEAVEQARQAYTASRLQEKQAAGYLPGFGLARPTTLFDFADLPADAARFWDEAEAQVLAALADYAAQAQNGGGYQRRLFAQDAARGFAFIDVCRKRYDVVLMNPPFGEAAHGSKSYIKKTFRSCSNDIFQAFVERGINWLSKKGRVGVISARTGFFLDKSKDWRSSVVFANQMACFVDLGLGVLDDALVEVALYVLQSNTPIKNLILVNRQLDNREKDSHLLKAVTATVQGRPGGFGGFDQSLLAIVPDYNFAYWAPDSFLCRYADNSNFGNVISRVSQGLATASDFRFVRLGWEVQAHSIGRKSRWQRFSKGGEYSPPYDDIHLLVDWDRDGSQIKQYVCQQYTYLDGNWSFVVKNTPLYFKPGATYTVRTASAFAAKVLPSDCIFSHNAQCWFHDSEDTLLLSIGFTTARVIQCYIELAVGGGDIATSGSAARRYTTTAIESIPSRPFLHVETQKSHLAISKMVNHRLEEFRIDETSCLFAAFHLNSSFRNLKQATQNQNRLSIATAVESLYASRTLDCAVSEAFDLTESEYHFIDQEIGPHPTAYSGSVEDSEVLRLYNLPENELIAEAVTKHGAKRWLTKKSYFVDRRIEVICHHLNISPERVLEALDDEDILLGLDQYVCNTVSELLGLVLGRWDIRYATGEKLVPELPDPFAPLPACPPGMLQNAAGLPAAPEDVPAAYPLRISWPGILVDDAGHPEDIEARVREALRVIWGARADAIEQEACAILGAPSLRAYFANSTRFFDDHLKRYSKSRRAAPIYWPLATPSGSYTLWLYYHRLTDQTLYTCVNDFVDPKLQALARQLSGLRGKLRRSSDDERELERLSTLEVELQGFREELLRLAAFWKPNLNDGVQITAAPLWRLFPHRGWQQRLRETWENLEAGEYDWAHLALSLWSERVIPACTQDRSFAIAHEIEDLFWVEDAGKWRALGEPEAEIAAQQERLLQPDRERTRVLLAELAAGPAQGVPAYQVCQHLAEGAWDDLPLARHFWPERVADKLWDEPQLALQAGLLLPDKRTQAARKRFLKEQLAAGAPELAEAFVAAFQDVEAPFEQVWAALARGAHDAQPLALALWPERVLENCLYDAELAAIHDLRRCFWVQGADGSWRRRKKLRQEVQEEVARRQRGIAR